MGIINLFRSLLLIMLCYSPAVAEEGVSSTHSELQSAYNDGDRGIESTAGTKNKLSVSYSKTVVKHKISATFYRIIIDDKKFEHLILHHKVDKHSGNSNKSSKIDLHYGVGVFKKIHFFFLKTEIFLLPDIFSRNFKNFLYVGLCLTLINIKLKLNY